MLAQVSSGLAGFVVDGYILYGALLLFYLFKCRLVVVLVYPPLFSTSRVIGNTVIFVALILIMYFESSQYCNEVYI